MYNIGDKIVYPMHGAGVIESIEEKEILGKTQSYYVLRMPVGDMMVMIPTEKAEGAGIRDVIDLNSADAVFSVFTNEETDEVNSNWNKRYRENMTKIKSGNIFEVAEVVKSLMIREKEKGLSTGERKMLSSAKQILVSELVLAKNIKQEEVENIISSSLNS